MGVQDEGAVAGAGADVGPSAGERRGVKKECVGWRQNRAKSTERMRGVRGVRGTPIWSLRSCGCGFECGCEGVDVDVDVDGLWIMDCGLWIVDCGLWIVDGGDGPAERPTASLSSTSLARAR
jgi:hypothetical protein